MALRDFWMNVRTAANSVAPRAIIDSPQLDPAAIERTLRGAVLWLTPRAVAGFDEADFDFLPGADRTHLAELVNAFRSVASKVGPKAPAPQQVIDEALPLFHQIVEFLAFGRYEDPEAFRLGKLIERELAADWPPELAELRFRTGLDHTGDPGLWIWVFLTEEAAATDDEFLSNAQELRQYISPVAHAVAQDRWPYISFRAIAEEADLMEVE